MNQDKAIEGFIAPTLKGRGYALVRVRLSGAKRKTLQVMAERLDGGAMTVDDCADISRALSALLDVEDPITDSYVLEVGSAGLDRHLTDKRDFSRFKGFEAKLECKRPDENGQRKFRGFIENTDDNGITIKTQERGSLQLQWQNLSMARLVASDDLLKALQNNSV